MIRILYIIIFSIIVSNCTTKKVVKHHGVPFLEKKQTSLVVNKTNRNDIIKLLGQPSTQSKFDNDILIYIEREISRGKLLNLGRNILVKNDVLILEIDSRGLLLSKNFNNINDMNDIKFSDETTVSYRKKTDFIYNFLSSLRQKINDPLGVRK